MATIPGYVKEVSRKTPIQDRRSADADRLSPVAALVQRHDRDRFQTVLFAPAARREALFALYAFNYEIARVRESVTQPMLGQIRLQWWRENIGAAFGGGAIRHHPVVEALAAIRDLGLTRDHFDRLIDARETDLADEPPASLAALEDYAEGTSSRLIYLALEALEVRDMAALVSGRHVGIAYALSGLLRAVPFLAAAGRSIIPRDIAARSGLEFGDFRGRRSSPALCAAVAEIAAAASKHLQAARALRNRIPRSALPALLPAIIAQRSLTRLKQAGDDPFDPALATPDPLQSWRLAVAALFNRF
ncbi:MAG TPA: squalene/phytoene synthase family protein [Stellaceae bacterium]|nr:squalene/phytoene synthase family protein [Stellaceae bacterium]